MLNRVRRITLINAIACAERGVAWAVTQGEHCKIPLENAEAGASPPRRSHRSGPTLELVVVPMPAAISHGIAVVALEIQLKVESVRGAFIHELVTIRDAVDFDESVGVVRADVVPVLLLLGTTTTNTEREDNGEQRNYGQGAAKSRESHDSRIGTRDAALKEHTGCAPVNQDTNLVARLRATIAGASA